MGEVSLDVAVGVLEDLETRNARVHVSGMGFGWSLGFIGRIAGIADGAVRFALPDGEEAMALRLDMDDVVFWSGDTREVPREIRRGITGLDAAPSFIGIVLPYRVAPETMSGPACDQEHRPRERIFFCEVPASAENGNQRMATNAE